MPTTRIGASVRPRVARAALLSLILALGTSAPVLASTWYVIPDGTGDATTVQEGLSLAAGADTVLVAAGTYDGPIVMVTAVVLTSESGPASTVLQGRSASQEPLVLVRDCSAATEISGFTIRGQRNVLGWGGGIYCQDSDVRIADNVITDNESTHDLASGGAGGGIFVYRGAPIIEDNNISENRCPSVIFDGPALGGGGIGLFNSDAIVRNNFITLNYVEYPFGPEDWTGGGISCRREGSPGMDGRPLIRGNFVLGNIAGQGGGIYVDDPQAVVEENDIRGNTAVDGGGIAVSRATSIAFNTIANNTAVEGGSGIQLGFATATPLSATVASNTIHGNSCLAALEVAAVLVTGAGTATVEHNIISGTRAGYGIACPGAATLTIACNDIFGNEAGEVGPSCPPVLGVNGNFSLDPLFCDAELPDFTLDADSPCVNAPGCGSVGRFGVGCDLGPGARTIWPTVFGRAAPSAYTSARTAPSSAPDPLPTALPTSPAGGQVLEVPTEFGTIVSALAAAAPGDTVLVLPGTYDERVSVPSAVTLLARDGRDVTTIAGDGGGSTVSIVFGAAGTVLDGFTITGGRAASGGGAFVVGGAPLVQHCRFIENVADGALPDGLGGGVFVDGGDAKVRCSVIAGNEAVAGGGIAYRSGGATAESLDVVNNLAHFHGGGVLTILGPRFEFCTIARNQAKYTGGGYRGSMFVWIESTTLDANTVTDGLGANVFEFEGAVLRDVIVSNAIGSASIFSANTSWPWVDCACFWNPGEDDIDGYSLEPWPDDFPRVYEEDPLFCAPSIGDYRLQPASPCADAPECGQLGRFGIGCAGPIGVPELVGSVAPRLTVHPNPSRRAALVRVSDRGVTHVDVFDVTGRRIRRLTLGTESSAVWDLRTERGARVAAGVYYVRVPDGTTTMPLVVR